VRTFVILVIQGLLLWLLIWLMPGVRVDGPLEAIIAVAVVSVLNALLWPFLSYLILPFAVLTLGIGALFLNALIILLTSWLMEGFHVDSIWAAMWLTLVMTVANTILSGLLTINDDNSWYRNAVRRRVQRRAQPEPTDVPGVLMLEFDGLAEPVLERAMAQGYMPTLARWVREGSHRLVGWETDLSSQTSASQSGILMGSNQNIPAFRWWDRARKQIVSTGDPQEVIRLEQVHSSGDGLLVQGGASRCNVFSGDAPNVMLTASAITDRTRFHAADFYAFFAYPYNAARVLILLVGDILLEIWQYLQDRRHGVYPLLDRHKRGGVYPILRAFTNVFMRELNIDTLIGDMLAGVPSAYATFVGYDEVAHHSGVESPYALDVLSKMDRQLSRLERALEEAPRPYHLVLLSDHGQSGGASFQHRYGITLEQFVQELATEKFSIQGAADVHEDWGQVNVFLTEVVQHDRKVVSRPLSQALKGNTEENGRVGLGPEGVKQKGEEGEQDTAEALASRLVVLGSGNLGLVYSSSRDERATLEEIEDFLPDMLEGMAQHEGIGFVMVHSGEHGPVVIGAEGRHYLAEGRVEGEDPLTGYGPRAVQHLIRTDSFVDAPDILVVSSCVPDRNEVTTFEYQIGSHGGLGGWQTQPFLLYPVELEIGVDEIVGAEGLHKVLKSWVPAE
jgi:uncharacterized membrane protein YvlD (DUF360 family)